MELKDLVGEHTLDAVDVSNIEMGSSWDDESRYANVISFRLDGTVYTAIEDPNDGYGAVILEVGTESIDDYYPSFVDRWYPDKMGINT